MGELSHEIMKLGRVRGSWGVFSLFLLNSLTKSKYRELPQNAQNPPQTPQTDPKPTFYPPPLMTSPPPPRQDPLAIPGVVRITLEHHQAQMLAGLGELFIAVSPASYPHQPGLALLVLPVTKQTATDACRVALGECRATRIRTKL
jgi:hypothetical protein